MRTQICYRCGETDETSLEVMYEHSICQSCRSKLFLFRDETLKKHIKSYAKKGDMAQGLKDYQDELKKRLNFVEKDYITKKIKLSYLLDRLDDLSF